MDVFKPKLRTKYIEYTINKYFINEHKQKYKFVLSELKNNYFIEYISEDLKYEEIQFINILVLIIHIFILFYNS